MPGRDRRTRENAGTNPHWHPPLCRDRDGAKQLTLTFSGDERSDWINFVLKDGNSWFDNKGTNFHVPLRAGATTTTEPQRQQQVRLLHVWTQPQV